MKKKVKSRKKQSQVKVKRHVSQSQGEAIALSLFWPLVVVCLILWIVYRFLFRFPVWFDESLGKLLFFGLPVWFFVVVSGIKMIPEAFAQSRMRRGLMMGIAIGGIFGFLASLLALWQKGQGAQSLSLFLSDAFWWEFMLAVFTGFWETLFFYCFVMLVIQKKYSTWPLLWQIILVSLIFLVFHLPNTILRFAGWASIYQATLLFFFAIGQGFLFCNEKNGYALVLSQALWGMVLLIQY